MNDSNLVQVGWMVETRSGPMVWPSEYREEANSYCEDGARPVRLWAYSTDIEQHETDQAMEATPGQEGGS